MNQELDINEIFGSFEEVTPQQADQLLQEGHGPVFIGRPSCPYCRIFANKLYGLTQEHEFKVYYVNSVNPDNLEEINKFRDKYQIPTVPGFIHPQTEGIQSRSDSSMSPEEIMAFINK